MNFDYDAFDADHRQTAFKMLEHGGRAVLPDRRTSRAVEVADNGLVPAIGGAMT